MVCLFSGVSNCELGGVAIHTNEAWTSNYRSYFLQLPVGVWSLQVVVMEIALPRDLTWVRIVVGSFIVVGVRMSVI